MEVGEYIRTKGGLIFKVRKIETSKTDIYWVNDEIYLLEEDIKAHSKDIIDLIETGDIVNGWKVGLICYGEKEGVKHTINFELEDGQPYSWKEKFGEEMCDFQLKIETILTHEQYEQNCYKIGE